MTSPSPISDDDYEAIAEAVMETERGRWFLTEYSRRNRSSDTALVLEALAEIERRLGDRVHGPSETFPDLMRNISARAGMLREELETGPAETRSSRALRHLDRLDHLISLAAPKTEAPLAIMAPESQSREITAPLDRTAALIEDLREPAPEPASLEVLAAELEMLAVSFDERETPPLQDEQLVVIDPPAIAAEEPAAPEASVFVTPVVEESPLRPADALLAVREEARIRRQSKPEADPIETPRPRSSGSDLLASLSAAEKAMLFA